MLGLRDAFNEASSALPSEPSLEPWRWGVFRSRIELYLLILED